MSETKTVVHREQFNRIVGWTVEQVQEQQTDRPFPVQLHPQRPDMVKPCLTYPQTSFTGPFDSGDQILLCRLKPVSEYPINTHTHARACTRTHTHLPSVTSLSLHLHVSSTPNYNQYGTSRKYFYFDKSLLLLSNYSEVSNYSEGDLYDSLLNSVIPYQVSIVRYLRLNEQVV